MKINRLFSLELERNSLRPYQIAVEVGTVFIPVSYTHLDVYKRQVLPIEIIVFNSFLVKKQNGMASEYF